MFISFPLKFWQLGEVQPLQWCFKNHHQKPNVNDMYVKITTDVRYKNFENKNIKLKTLPEKKIVGAHML